MSIQFSRGCPFNCEFCDITKLYGHIPRTKDPAQLIAELDAIRQLDWRGPVFIVDDNFIGNQKAVREFLPILIDWQEKNDYPFSFFTEASLDLANENLVDIRENMVKAGFNEVFCGIESVNVDVLFEMGKKQNRGDIAKKVRTLQESGLEVTAGFIIGSDADLPTVFEDIFKFIQNQGIVTAMTGLLTALRGTRLYKRLSTEGRIRTESSGNNTHQLCLNFEPKTEESVLIKGYVNLLDCLFSSQNYFNRCRALRQRLGPGNRSMSISRSNILAALKIFYRNIAKRPDWEFVKFIFGTLLTAPRNLPVAIKQAVKLAHFQRITRETVRAHHYPEHVATLAELFQNKVAKLNGNIQNRLEKLARLEKKTIAKATEMYISIDPDFRGDAEKKLKHWCQHFTYLANRYRQIWQG